MEAIIKKHRRSTCIQGIENADPGCTNRSYFESSNTEYISGSSIHNIYWNLKQVRQDVFRSLRQPFYPCYIYIACSF